MSMSTRPRRTTRDERFFFVTGTPTLKHTYPCGEGSKSSLFLERPFAVTQGAPETGRMPTMHSSQPSQALLESLAVRFILTLPRSELESFERLLFSVEQACACFDSAC